MTKELLLFLEKNARRKKKKRPNLSMLTVVIPSYCRQDFIIRQCAHWYGQGAALVIMDGSPDPLSCQIQKVISDLDGINYVHLNVNLVDRLQYASTLIKTPFTVMCGDDEFLLASGVSNAISLLEQDQDLVACIGQSLHFYLSDNGSKCKYGPGYDTHRYTVRQDSINDRLKASVKNYNAATCYAVTRSSVWCKSWGNLQKYSSGWVLELEHAFTTYIWGKLGSVDDYYWMRSSENPPAITADVSKLPLQEWWGSAKFKYERLNFITKIGEEMIHADQMDRANAEALAVEVFESYLKENQKKRSRIYLFHLKCRRLVVNLLRKSMPKLVDCIIEFRSRLRQKTSVTAGFGSLMDMKTSKISVSFSFNDELIADLSSMERLIADFYTARKF